MSKLGKICAYLGVFILLLSAAALSFATVSYAEAADSVGSDSGKLRYEYLMTKPIAVSFSESGLFVLDEKSQVVKINQYGMTSQGEHPNATAIAALGDNVVTDESDGEYSGAVSLFSDGNYFGAVMPQDIRYNGVLFAETDKTFLCGDAYGGKLYVCETDGKNVSVYAYDLSDKTANRALIERNIKTDGAPVAMTVVGDDEIYYATDYSLFTVGKSVGEDIGGITSLSNDGQALYYTTRSGKLRRRVNGVSRTVICSAESVSAATRKNFAVFADEGNNKVTVIRENGEISVTVEQPLSAAVGYNGNIYVASENRVIEYTRSLEEISAREVGDGEKIVQIKVDPSDVTGNTVYALTASGELIRMGGKENETLDGTTVIRFDISQSGNIFALTDGGDVIKCNSDFADAETVAAAGIISEDIVDITLDAKENVFCATENKIYKNGEEIAAVELSDIREIDVSFIAMSGKNAVGYGDIIVISSKGCANNVIAASAVGTDMGDGEDGDLDDFVEKADKAEPNGVSRVLDLRKTVMVADIYDRPSESPNTLGETAYGTYVIVIAEYPNTDYVYAIVESPRGSSKGAVGFINKNSLGDPLPLERLYEEEDCRPLKKSKIYKYPSLVSPVVGEAAIGQSYAFLDFAYGYRDGAGRGWCRIRFEDDGGVHEGYVLRGDVTTSSSTSGDNKVIVPDAYVKAGKNAEVEIYELGENGEFVAIGTIKNGEKLQLEEPYRRNNEFTKVTYLENEETGAIRTCYVKTEYVKLTVGSWYQVIMFVVGGVLIAAVIIIIFVAVKKKKKIQQ